MTQLTIKDVLAALPNFDAEELRTLNHYVVEEMKIQHQRKSAVAATTFKVGDVVRFTKAGRGRGAGTHFVKVEGFNRARTSLVGHEVTPDGKDIPFSAEWVLAPIHCTKVK